MREWGITDTGLVRTENQDAYAIRHLDGCTLAVVCDGMGGVSGGQIASRVAVDSFCRQVEANWKPDMPQNQLEQMLAYSVSAVNDDIRAEAKNHPGCERMGTTLVAALVCGDTLQVLNVGDSRAYRVSTAGIEQISHDHSVVENMVEKGELTPQEARRHPNRNLITRALGPEEQVREAVLSFSGELLQVPPMYSALKFHGQKLVDLARRGIEVERKARPVTVHHIEIGRMELPRVWFTVTCSRGTYIRTICHDIGRKLGTGGAMEHLVRTRVGRFTAEQALKLSDIQRMTAEGTQDRAVISVEEIFGDLPGFTSRDAELDKFLNNGNPFGTAYYPAGEGMLRVYNSAGDFIGVYRYSAERGMWMAVHIFR